MEGPYNVYGGLQDNGTWYGPSRRRGRHRQQALELAGCPATASGPSSIPTTPTSSTPSTRAATSSACASRPCETKDIKPRPKAGRAEVPLQLEHAHPPEPDRAGHASTSARSSCSARGTAASPGSASRPTSRPTIPRSSSRTSRAASRSTTPPPRTTARSSRSPSRRRTRRDLGGHRRRQRAGDPRRRQDLDQRGRRTCRACPGTPGCRRVEASRFDEGTAYATFDGHMTGDMKTYVYRTTDFGEDLAASLVDRRPQGLRARGPRGPA